MYTLFRKDGFFFQTEHREHLKCMVQMLSGDDHADSIPEAMRTGLPTGEYTSGNDRGLFTTKFIHVFPAAFLRYYAVRVHLRYLTEGAPLYTTITQEYEVFCHTNFESLKPTQFLEYRAVRACTRHTEISLLYSPLKEQVRQMGSLIAREEESELLLLGS